MAVLSADNWCLKVEDKVYGPYTSVQLRKFAQEGRFAAWSMIAPAGSRDWREAREETALAAIFGETPSRTPANEPGFGKQVQTGQEAAPAAPRRGPRRAKTFGGRRIGAEAPATSAANFLIIFDVVSGAASRVEGAVMGLGPAVRIADNVWSVTCAMTAVGVRNAIAPFIRPTESIFVVDATNGRSTWQNYAPEVHARLTRAYLKPRD